MDSLDLKQSIKLLFKLAIRQLKRDKRRTLITGSAISLGLALFIFSDHIQQGSYQSLIKVGISTQAGHIVIQAQEHKDEQKIHDRQKLSKKLSKKPSRKLNQLDQRIEKVTELQMSLEQALSHAKISGLSLARAEIGGLLHSPVGGARTRLLAIDPQLEPKVSDWHKRLVPAKLPQGEKGEPIKSHWLKQDDDRGILLGQKLAERLDLTVGDKVVFSYSYQQENQSRLFRVRGVLKLSSEDQEASTALITLNAYNSSLNTQDQAQKVSIHLEQIDLLPQALAISHKLVKAHQAKQTNARLKLESLSWQEALPALYQFTLKDRQTSLAIFLIMGVMIAIGVLNTVAMSALERQRYFGVMMALGLSPKLMGALLVVEAFVLGIFASMIGLVLGILVSWPAVEYGLDLSEMVGEGMEVGGVVMETTIHAVWHPEGLLLFTSASIILSLLASLWPAWRTTHLSALDAMRGPDTQ